MLSRLRELGAVTSRCSVLSLCVSFVSPLPSFPLRLIVPLEQTGANLVYTPETGITLKQLTADVDFLKKRYGQDVKGKSEGRLVIRFVSFLCPFPTALTDSLPTALSSEKASKTYTTEVITNILADEGKDVFDSRLVALGHTLQGGVPSPRDRTRAVRLTVKCIDWLEQQSVSNADAPGAATIAIQGAGIRFVGVDEMMASADFKNRRGKVQWWQPVQNLVEVLAGRVNLENEPLTQGVVPLVAA